MKKREVALITLFFTFFVLLVLNFGLHIFRTMNFNSKKRLIKAYGNTDLCSFNLHFRGGTTDSWLKRDVPVYSKYTTLRGATFDGVFTNDSEYEISSWKLKIDIVDDCFINNAWCGKVEIHQNGRSQILDLRNVDRKNVELNYLEIDQDFLVPLKKGDYIIYYPSVEADEVPIRGSNGSPGTMTMGFIFYKDIATGFNLSNYNVVFSFNKKLLQGKDAVIFTTLFVLWLMILVLKITVRFAYKKAAVEAEHQLYIQRLEDMKVYNARLNTEVENKTHHIQEIQQKVVAGLANVIGNRDPDTGGHVKRTSEVIGIILDEFRKQHPDLIDDVKAYDICRAAPMHDLGKIYIESSILCKPGKLTDSEYDLMKNHSVNSGEIVNLVLKDVEESHFVETAFNVARYHHERWDGKGYPNHLSGEEIPLEARIMSVADVYDALVSRRCYKQPMSFEKAAEIMTQGMGTQFDPQMKSVFEGCRSRLEEYYKENNK